MVEGVGEEGVADGAGGIVDSGGGERRVSFAY